MGVGARIQYPLRALPAPMTMFQIQQSVAFLHLGLSGREELLRLSSIRFIGIGFACNLIVVVCGLAFVFLARLRSSIGAKREERYCFNSREFDVFILRVNLQYASRQ